MCKEDSVNLREIKGLKYPDSYFIRFFFKNGLQNRKLRYLEFGCGNGNNLMLPFSYGNEVIGVDINEERIKEAKFNIKGEFFCEDMREFVKNREFKVDVVSLPNIINYICKKDFEEFLKNLKKFYEKGLLFIRFRSYRDFRYGRGEDLGRGCYKTLDDLTSEKGAINCFYSEVEMVDLLRKYLNLKNYYLFHIDFENLAKDKIILNSDIVIWGEIE